MSQGSAKRFGKTQKWIDNIPQMINLSESFLSAPRGLFRWIEDGVLIEGPLTHVSPRMLIVFRASNRFVRLSYACLSVFPAPYLNQSGCGGLTKLRRG